MRLIDADALMRDFLQDREGFDVCVVYDTNIRHASTIDAVPVVRCKDCMHYELDACLKIYQDGNISNDAWQERKPNDFCSYGERVSE